MSGCINWAHGLLIRQDGLDRMQRNSDDISGGETMACLKAQAKTALPTVFGELQVSIYSDDAGQESLAIFSGKLDQEAGVPVRVHSACFTAEVLGSLKCDCKHQLDFALGHIAAQGGVVLYLPQEGRGVGLSNKIRAYALQERGYDTVDANRALGLPDDARSYHDAAFMLRDLGVSRVRLITNNPQKIQALEELGIEVVERIPIPLMATEHSSGYLETKRRRMGHLFDPLVAAATSNHQEKLPVGAASRSHALEDRPFVHVNFALDTAGRTTLGIRSATPLSCPEDWQRVHELRERYAAVVVGARTWQIDRPQLTARAQFLARAPRRQPDRVIFAGRSACDVEPDERRTFVVGLQPQPPGIIRITALEHDLETPLASLLDHGVDSLLVEGGLTLLRSFIRKGMVDRLSVYVTTDSIEAAEDALNQALPELDRQGLTAERFGQGVLLTSGKELEVMAAPESA